MATATGDLEDAYREMEAIVRDLIECYALPHTRMCLRWSKPTREAYREEVVSWLDDYAKSFARLPRKCLEGREELPSFARRRLEEEIARVLGGRHSTVEESYDHLFR